MDAPEVRPLIQDFLEHAQWFLFHRVKDRTIPGLMLKKPIHMICALRSQCAGLGAV